MAALLNDSRFTWLFDEAKCMTGEAMRGPNRWKPTILAELGRVDDVEELKSIALLVCRIKPSTKEAVAFIRHLRLGKAPGAFVDNLAATVVRVVEEYLAVHPGPAINPDEPQDKEGFVWAAMMEAMLALFPKS